MAAALVPRELVGSDEEHFEVPVGGHKIAAMEVELAAAAVSDCGFYRLASWVNPFGWQLEENLGMVLALTRLPEHDWVVRVVWSIHWSAQTALMMAGVVSSVRSLRPL